jgi:hypothetical protein
LVGFNHNYNYGSFLIRRFLLLEDCGHTFEVSGLDKWIGAGLDQNGILVRRCPKCKTVVGKSRRYGKVLKGCMKDVMTVKKKIFGGGKNTYLKLRDISRKLEKQGAGFPEIHFFRKFISLHVYKNPNNPITSSKRIPDLKRVRFSIWYFLLASRNPGISGF